ncbi:MAG: hypothetical protein IPK82_11410 [Polyangiaceae bacterium]|nr:hypothetical protein [Polyangiaceae bacterium]
MHPLLKDPWFAAQIDAVIEKQKQGLTPEQIEVFREKIAWTFANHPAAQRILERERAAHVDTSGTRIKAGVDLPEPADKAGGDNGHE